MEIFDFLKISNCTSLQD